MDEYDYRCAMTTIAESQKAGRIGLIVMVASAGAAWLFGSVFGIELLAWFFCITAFAMGMCSPILMILASGGCGCGHPRCPVDRWNSMTEAQQSCFHKAYRDKS